MAGKESERGPTAATVSRNVTRAREAQNLNYTQVSERLARIGRPISAVGVRRIEAGDRRVDVDDLLALSVALEVSPVGLLMPRSETPESLVTATGIGELAANELLPWLRAEVPLPQQVRTANWHLSVPEWQVEADKARIANTVKEEGSRLFQFEEMERRLKSLEQKLQARGDD